MIHKALTKLKEQRGSSLIFGVAMAVFLLIVSLVVMEAVKIRTTVAYIQTTAQQVLNSSPTPRAAAPRNPSKAARITR